ncbi:MAG TPA: hypothetical protein VIT65_13880 [Microlunatus sp.]
MATFSDGIKLFGTSYAAGATAPAMSASVTRSLTRRGRLNPTGGLTVRRPVSINGTAYAAGAAAPAVTGALKRRLLRGKIIK